MFSKEKKQRRLGHEKVHYYYTDIAVYLKYSDGFLLLEARITEIKEKVQFLQDQVPREPRPNREPAADNNSRFRNIEIPWI